MTAIRLFWSPALLQDLKRGTKPAAELEKQLSQLSFTLLSSSLRFNPQFWSKIFRLAISASICIWIRSILVYEVVMNALIKSPYSKTYWSLGYTPVKTVCMSTVMPCVNQQTFPATIRQRPFCTLFRKPNGIFLMTSCTWYLYHCYLDSSNGPHWLTLTLHFCCVQESPLKIMSVPTLRSTQCPMYSMNPWSRDPLLILYTYTHISKYSPFTQALGPQLYFCFCKTNSFTVILQNYTRLCTFYVFWHIKGKFKNG